MTTTYRKPQSREPVRLVSMVWNKTSSRKSSFLVASTTCSNLTQGFDVEND